MAAGTALRSASQQGKQQTAEHGPVLLPALCPQLWHVRGSGGHHPSAATSLLPAAPPGIPPTTVSPSFLAERTRTASTPGLQQHGRNRGSAQRHPCLPALSRSGRPPPATARQAEQPAAPGRQQPAEEPRTANGGRTKPCVCCQACWHPRCASSPKERASSPLP